MINGLNRSSAFQVKQSQAVHKKKLQDIQTGKKCLISFDSEAASYLDMAHRNHTRSRSFRTTEKNRSIKWENRKMIMSMIKIATREAARSPVYKMRHFNEYYAEKRRKQLIQQQNPQIAHRISSQKTLFPKKQDDLEFRESRKRLRRLEKFKTILKLADLGEEKYRVVTEPAKCSKVRKYDVKISNEEIATQTS